MTWIWYDQLYFIVASCWLVVSIEWSSMSAETRGDNCSLKLSFTSSCNTDLSPPVLPCNYNCNYKSFPFSAEFISFLRNCLAQDHPYCPCPCPCPCPWKSFVEFQGQCLQNCRSVFCGRVWFTFSVPQYPTFGAPAKQKENQKKVSDSLS